MRVQFNTYTGRNKNTLLGNAEAVKLLVEQAGADANRDAKNGWTPLLEAVHAGHYGIAKYLLGHGADINRTNEKGISLLMTASAAGNPKDADFLIRHGAELDQREKHGATALMLAVFRNHLPVVKVLVKAGADTKIELKNSLIYNGTTALGIAKKMGFKDIEAFLEKNEAR